MTGQRGGIAEALRLHKQFGQGLSELQSGHQFRTIHLKQEE